MKEEALSDNQQEYFSSEYILSDEPEENNFHSFMAKPENIFCEQSKENIEQLSSKILCFPFSLELCELINLKDKNGQELDGGQLIIILGSLEKLKMNDLILKLIFISKDKNYSLNLKDFPEEINSLINLGLEFIGVLENKLFIKCENESSTNEAYISLQKCTKLFDFLYEEEKDLNSLEEQIKSNSFNNFNRNNNNQKIYSEEKKQEDKSFRDFKNKDEAFKLNQSNKQNEKINYYLNNTYKREENNLNNIAKNLWNNKINNFGENIKLSMEVKKNLFNQNNQNASFYKEQQASQKFNNLNNFSPLIYPQIFYPMNNIQKMQQINPSLLISMLKSNPFFIQNTLAFQNYLKMQQQSQMNNINCINNNINKGKKDFYYNLKNFNQNINNNKKINLNINSNMNKNNNLSPVDNNEPSTNSNSPSSTKDSSPILNYQNKTINNFKIGADDLKNNMTKKNEGNYNLEEIILNNKYKEYIPKNNMEKEVQFHTNSSRDYQFKYVSRYIVQIENEKNFPVTKMIIGNNGMLLRQILLDNCIKYGDHTTKIRLRGKGSGYKEGPKNEESKDPMELCISSLNMISFSRCTTAIENMLLKIYYQYYLYQCKNFLEEKNDLNNNKMGYPNIVMKKILKYHYVVNRYNTLVKEEKRRQKEEELKRINNNNEQNCFNDNINNNQLAL